MNTVRLVVLSLLCGWALLSLSEIGVSADSKNPFCNFLEEKNKAENKNVEFRALSKKKAGYVGGQCGMFALQDIKEGETVFSYSLVEPFSVISADEAKRDPRVGHLFTLFAQEDQKEDASSKDKKEDVASDETVKETETTEKKEEEVKEASTTTEKEKIYLYEDEIIKMYTLYLKFNSIPEWKPYIDALPRLVDIPALWKKEELEELKGSKLYGSAMAANETMHSDYKLLFPKLSNNYPEIFPADKFTFEEFAWVYSVHVGRLWYKNKKIFNPLFPIMEVFNYKEDSAVKVVDTEEGVVHFIATEDIEKGEEIFVNDGKLSNRELLEYYGFVLEKNPANQVELGVGLDRSDRLYGNKKKLLHERGLRDGQTYVITSEGSIPDDLIFALRVYHISVYDYEESSNAFNNRMISSQNEMAVINTITDTVMKTLKGYVTSGKQDKALMEEKNLPKRKRNAVILRRGEKRILAKTLQRANSAMDQVKAKWDQRNMDIPGGKELSATLLPQEIL